MKKIRFGRAPAASPSGRPLDVEATKAMRRRHASGEQSILELFGFQARPTLAEVRESRVGAPYRRLAPVPVALRRARHKAQRLARQRSQREARR